MLLLFSVLFLNTPPLQADPEAFKHFKKTGTEAYCLVDYQHKTVSCLYETMAECREQYSNQKVAVCFSRKSLKMGDK